MSISARRSIKHCSKAVELLTHWYQLVSGTLHSKSQLPNGVLTINKSQRSLKHFVDEIHKSNAAKCFRRSTSVETRFVVQWKSSPSLKQSVNASNVLPWRGRVPWRRGLWRRRTRLSQIKVKCCSPRERVAHSLFLGGGPPQNCTAQHSILSHPTNGSECSGRLIQFRSDRRGYSHKHFQERIPTPLGAAAAGREGARANARTRFHASYAPNDAAAALRGGRRRRA